MNRRSPRRLLAVTTSALLLSGACGGGGGGGFERADADAAIDVTLADFVFRDHADVGQGREGILHCHQHRALRARA